MPRTRREIFLLARNSASSARVTLARRPQVERSWQEICLLAVAVSSASLARSSTHMRCATNNTYKSIHTYTTCLLLHMSTVGNEVLLNSIYNFYNLREFLVHFQKWYYELFNWRCGMSIVNSPCSKRPWQWFRGWKFSMAPPLPPDFSLGKRLKFKKSWGDQLKLTALLLYRAFEKKI